MEVSIRSATTAIEVRRLGTVDYRDAWQLQRDLADARVAGGPDTLLLLEHPPVYTAGKRTEPHERPLDGTPVVDVDRGGKNTWHGPGQPVGDPIGKLASHVYVVGYIPRVEGGLVGGWAGVGGEKRRGKGR